MFHVTNVCAVANEDVCFSLYVGMLLLASIAACDIVIPVFDCMIYLSVL